MPSRSGEAEATGRVRIASRGSELALWQAHAVRQAIADRAPGLRVEIEVVRTTGDRITDVPLSRIGDRGLFTKEIDATLLEGRAEVAVHSLKDVPTRLPDGLVIAAVTEREDPRDVLICRPGAAFDLDSLPVGARVGTSSLRRRAQLRACRPDVEVVDLRGNLNTRLGRLDRGEYDAILLAAAGVIRLGWRDRVSAWLEPAGWLPAVGQGALAVVARADAAWIAELLGPLHHAPTADCVAAERAFLHALEGGCQIPIGALATAGDDALHLSGLVAGLDGSPVLRAALDGARSEPERLGRALADELLRRGAADVLDAIRGDASTPVPPP